VDMYHTKDQYFT